MDSPAAWESEYCSRGRMWGGSVHPLPLLPGGSRVLELGCGSGRTLPALLRRDWRVTATDFSVHAMTLSRQALSDKSRVDLIVADARSSPFKDQTFDAVFARHIIGHLHEGGRKQTSGEIIRLLKPGGLLFFCEFSPDDFRFGHGGKTEERTFLRGNGITTHYFTADEIGEMFTGLTPLSIHTNRWRMRVRGTDLVRSEITALLVKPL